MKTTGVVPEPFAASTSLLSRSDRRHAEPLSVAVESHPTLANDDELLDEAGSACTTLG